MSAHALQGGAASPEDGEPASSPSGAEPSGVEPEPGRRVIRVVDVRRRLADLNAASPDELALILEAARRVPALSHAREALNAFASLAQAAQAPAAALRVPPAPGVLSSVAARTLLASPAVRPVAEPRAARPAAETEEPHIRTRPATRVRAVGTDAADQAIAAEDPTDIIGFATDPQAAWAFVAALRPGGAGPWPAVVGAPYIGLDAAAQGGAYTAAGLAALTGPRALWAPPTAPPEDERPGEARAGGAPRRRPAKPDQTQAALLARAGFQYTPVSALEAAAPAELLRYARAAAEYYLSGAAAATAYARLGAALRGSSGAPPELLAWLAPARPVLSLQPPAGAPAAGASAPEPAWRTPEASEALHYVIDRLAKVAQLAADEPGTWAYHTSPLAALYHVGGLLAYLYALTEGRDSPRLDALLESAAIRHAKETQLAAIEHRAAVAAGRARLYLLIAEDKFGTARIVAILEALRAAGAGGAGARSAPGGSLARLQDTVTADDPNAVLAVLTRREREVVETEYDSLQREWAASAGNRCPHLRPARQLRRATNAADALAALNALSEYFQRERPEGRPRAKTSRADEARADGAKAGSDEWLRCKNCGFRVLCPHVRDRLRLEARRTPYEEVSDRLMRYAVRVRSPGGDAAYYCRICSERLSEALDEERPAEVLGRFGDLDAGIRTKVWTAALGAAQHVRFPVPTDERQFASAVTDVVYPLLMLVEEAVTAKGRRRRAGPSGSRAPAGPRPGRAPTADRTPGDEEEVDPRTQLYAVLYVYAYILGLVHATRSQRGREVGFAGVKPDAREAAYAERMLQTLAAEHRSLIAQIEDITPEYIKERFVEAYQQVLAGGAGLQTAPDPETELVVQVTTIDPVYQYAVAVARVAGDLPLSPPAGPAEARREFETVLGRSLPALIKTARENAKNPALGALYSRRPGAEVPPGGDLTFLCKAPGVNLYAEMYEAPPAAAGTAAVRAFREIAAKVTVPYPGLNTWTGAGESGGEGAGAGTTDITALTDEPEDEPSGEPTSAPEDTLSDVPEDTLSDVPEDTLSDVPESVPVSALGGAAAPRRAAPKAAGPRTPQAGPRTPQAGPRTPRAAPQAGSRAPEKSAAKPRRKLAALPKRPQPDHAEAERGYYFESYRLFARFTKSVASPEALAEFETELAAARRSEDGLRVAKAAASLKAPYDFGWTRSQQYEPVAVPITALYDEAGLRHVWSTYYYAVGDARSPAPIVVEGGPAGIKKAIAAGGIPREAVLVDQGCARCGVRQSEVGRLDAAAAWRSLRAAAEIGTFYAFYESRCPEGDLHEWAAGACRKCGLAAQVAGANISGAQSPADGARLRAYYDKYAARFAAEQREVRDQLAAVAARRRAPGARAAGPGGAQAAADEAAQAWRPDYTLVVRAAELAGTTPAAVEAIGAAGGREYADIVEGRGAPPPPTAATDPRAYEADAEVRTLLGNYHALRRYGRVQRRAGPLQRALAPYLEAAGPAAPPAGAPGQDPQAYAPLADLPAVGEDYARVHAAIVRLRPPADALTHAIQSLCRYALAIAEPASGADWAKRAARAFAIGELKTILRGQKLLSKPGAFNWAIFETNDTDLAPDQVGDVGEDLLIPDDAEEAPYDPFSGEAMDYDTSEGNPNNEPD